MSFLSGQRTLFLAFFFGPAIFLGSSIPALAGEINYTCAGNVDSAICSTLNSSLAGLYNSTFTNANANIYIQFGSTGLASTLQFFTNIDYTSYVDALTAAEGDLNDLTAVNSLGGDLNNPVVNGDGVAITSALAAALGLTNQAGSLGITAAGNACILGSSGCYNGRITVSNAPDTWYFRSGTQDSGTYDFYSAVEHETDEVLGTASCIVGKNNDPSTIATSLNCTNGRLGNPGTGVSAADLFRYSSPDVRSYLDTADGTLAYFSIDDGVTNIAAYNNQPDSADYGDWDSEAYRIQNAFGTPGQTGLNITNDGGSSIAVLDAVGYNLAAPEPGTIGLLALGLALAGGFKYRRRKRQQAGEDLFD